MIVLTAAGGPRLRGLAALGVAVAAAAPAHAFGWTDDALTENGVALEERIDARLLLGGALLAGAVLAAGAWVLFMREEPRVRWTRSRSQTTWFTLAAILLALIAGGITALAASDRGLGGSIEKAADDFTEVRQDKVYEPDRLLSTTSANRWAWWQEAFGAYADEPFTGWGAGSFPVSRRLYRVSPLEVQQPHSLPLQFAAETGTLGMMLGLGGLIALFAAAVARVAEMRHGRERDLAIALLAGGAAWSVHALADWDWDIPGVTLPVLLFLGVIAGRRPREHGRRGAWPQAMQARWAAGGRPAAAGTGRWLVLAAACLALAAFVASAVLPAWSDSKTDEALRAVADRAPERLEDGAAAAELAADLDPLAERPLFAAASIAEARDRALEAREHLLEAVDRAPWSAEAWKRLARIALGLADREGARAAALRLLALDPGNPDVIAFVQRAQGLLTPPEASGSAVGTPLTPGENQPAPEPPAPEPEPDPTPQPDPAPPVPAPTPPTPAP
jgi:O-antigen ligase